MTQEGIRINKYLSESGVCSRRQADTYIREGLVRINDMPATVGTRVYPGDQVFVRDTLVKPQEKRLILAFYKPEGLVCSTQGQGSETIWEYLKYPVPLYSVGRLDKNSEGLLLLTNDGELADAISRSRNRHEKEYEVWVNKQVSADFLEQMKNGVPILDTVTRRCRVMQTGSNSFRIVLTQGLNRQIRRMCEYCGYRVRKLRRVRVMNITLDGMKPGEYRELTEAERSMLKTLLKKTGSDRASKQEVRKK